MNESTPNFSYWDEYFGLLLEDHDDRFPSAIYGFSSETGKAGGTLSFDIPERGGVYGYVERGMAFLNGRPVNAGEFFALSNGGMITLDHNESVETRVIAVQRIGWKSMNCVGGPIEERGRLRYIDTCSDTCLIPPFLMGDPCINHLHFPVGVDQTQHTHPSTRAGIVARGLGACITPSGEYPLHPGRLFYIPRDGLHKFHTLRGTFMDVIAYHPDSDFGPTHETHPMVNRTWVDGQKIDNTKDQHAKADLESCWVPPISGT
jgi:hypothetical protein